MNVGGNDSDLRPHALMDVNLDKRLHHIGQLPTAVLEWIGENSNDLIVIWNKENEIIYISQSITNLLNYDPADFYRSDWRKLILSDESLFPSTRKNEVNIKTLNLNILNKSGERIGFQGKIEHVCDEVGNDTCFIGLFKKNTYEKESEELMILAEKMSITGQLVAGVAHEVRNPLTSLKGFLQLLKAGVDNKEVYLQIMCKEIEKIEAITSEFLVVAKPLTDKQEKKSIHSMISDVTLLLNIQANQQNITIINNRETDHFVICDASQIKQVLINLIKNAIEATEDAGIIEVLTRRSGSNVEVDIIDEGSGISEAVLARISEPFFTTKQEGSGLGLMISKQIIEKHNGSLIIKQNKNKGSTFRIILPAYTEP